LDTQRESGQHQTLNTSVGFSRHPSTRSSWVVLQADRHRHRCTRPIAVPAPPLHRNESCNQTSWMRKARFSWPKIRSFTKQTFAVLYR